jgi:hypothetical protein
VGVGSTPEFETNTTLRELVHVQGFHHSLHPKTTSISLAC